MKFITYYILLSMFILCLCAELIPECTDLIERFKDGKGVKTVINAEPAYSTYSMNYECVHDGILHTSFLRYHDWELATLNRRIQKLENALEDAIEVMRALGWMSMTYASGHDTKQKFIDKYSSKKE